MTTIIKTVFFNASPAIVWSFLTDKDKLGQWYHPARTDLAKGQDYELLKTSEDGNQSTLIWGRVLEMQPPTKLVTTFCIGPFGGAETTITFELSAVSDGTRLLLTHEGIAKAAGDTPLPLLSALDLGWDEHLAKLRGSTASQTTSQAA